MFAAFNTQPLHEVEGSRFQIGGSKDALQISIAVSHDGTRIFVAREATLTVLDGQTYKPVPGTPVRVGHKIQDIALSPDGARVFVLDDDLGVFILRPIFGAA
jgi:DNA-binding beta-propeller fold protein YncE